MAATSVDKLVKSFKNPTIAQIDGKPMYATIHFLHELLNMNAESVSTNLGCGTLRHLCLTLSPTVYVILLVTPVLPPPNPRAALIIPVCDIGRELESLRYAHNAATVAFSTFQNIYRNLFQQLMGSIEDKFV